MEPMEPPLDPPLVLFHSVPFRVLVLPPFSWEYGDRPVQCIWRTRMAETAHDTYCTLPFAVVELTKHCIAGETLFIW